MLKTMAEIAFHQEMLNDLVQSKYFDPNVPNLYVFDDLMRTVMNDDTSADLFREGAYHQNISIVVSYKICFFKASKVEQSL